MDKLNAIEGYLVRLEKAVIIVSMTAMLLAVSLQVFFRYVIPLSVPWTEELAVISFVLAIFYGAALASHRDRHLGIKNVVDLLSERTYIRIWYIKKILLTVFIAWVLIRHGFPMAANGWNNTFTIIRIPQFFVLVQIPLFGVLAVFHNLTAILRKDYLSDLSKAQGVK